MFKYIDCIDATTDYCPCSLAEVGECLVCSQLQKNCLCDCKNYQGACIYQEFIWNNEKSKRARQYKIYNIKSKKYIREDIMVLEIIINHELAMELNSIGAFVFLKRPGDLESCSVPISILDCDIYKNEITVGVKIVGVKTKMLSKCNDVIMVKGPYWNGIQGLRFLNKLSNEKCLIVGRGCALPPAIFAAKKLAKKNNDVFAILEKGRSKESYFKPYFDNMGIKTENARLMDRSNNLVDEGKGLIGRFLEENEVSTVLSAGNDIFHIKLIEYIHSLNNNINFATVNNATMCCGEGQCGSCMLEGPSGNKIKACKQQYNPIEIFLKKGAGE